MLGPWLEQLDPHVLKLLVHDLDQMFDGPADKTRDQELLAIVSTILMRELPKARGRFSDDELADGVSVLVVQAHLEQERRSGFVTFKGTRCLSDGSRCAAALTQNGRHEAAFEIAAAASATHGSDSAH